MAITIGCLITILASGCTHGLDGLGTNPFGNFSGGSYGGSEMAPPPPSHLSSAELLKRKQKETLAQAERLGSLASLRKYADSSHPIWTADNGTLAARTNPLNSPSSNGLVVRSQSPDRGGGGFGYGSAISSTPAGGSGSRNYPVSQAFQPQASGQDTSKVQKAAYQYPETKIGAPAGTVFDSGTQLPTIHTGNVNEMNPLVRRDAPSGVATFPQNYADLDIYVTEAQTGRINIGGAYNSDNGIVGQFTIDERNFDITRWPRSFQDIRDGVAWRGAGQTFRLELVPGAQVQRYLVSFGEPYLFNTPISLTTSAYLFDRQYFDWDEQRLGLRLALGYRLTHDMSISAGIRAENVEISDPRNNGSASLNEVQGDSDLYVANFSLIRDTRDRQIQATEGSYFSLSFQQAFGEFDYPRGDIELRRYRLLYQRPDGSGRHTVSFGTKLGFSGSQTPVFENYFAGGFSTMRGFDFRGVGPQEGDIRVGGRFQWLNTLEYTFPLTADDMIKGVLFCDFGTVEDEIEIDKDNFRIAPGFGFRIAMPALGMGAPLAFDFAFPIEEAEGDEKQTFSFYLGVGQ